MALSTAALATSQQKPAPQTDPFWHSTPRTNLPSLHSLMNSVQQVPLAAKPRIPKTSVRRPICTHTTVNRVYGDYACSMCHRIPVVGWVYACQQDRDEKPYQAPSLPLVWPDVLPDGSNDLELAALAAEYLEMSPCIIAGIRAGNYDAPQAAKLIKQRQNVIETIRVKEMPTISLLESDSSNTMSSVSAPSALMADGSLELLPMKATAESPVSTPQIKSHKPQRKNQQSTECGYKVCQACRPAFKDRMYSSFEAVLNGEVPELDEADMQGLPVMDRDIVINFGLRQPQASTDSLISLDITMRENDTEDEISVDWTPTEGTDSFSEHLNCAELYPCPGPHQCPVYSRLSGCAYDSGFEDGRRAYNHGFVYDTHRSTPDSSQVFLMKGEISSTASTVSLPTPATAPRFPLLIDDTFTNALKRQLAKARSSDFPSTTLHTRDSNTSFGSELEVHGGVALTEESVGRGMPDIVDTE